MSFKRSLSVLTLWACGVVTGFCIVVYHLDPAIGLVIGVLSGIAAAAIGCIE